MAHFLKGRYKGFYSAGWSECVKDTYRFKPLAEGKLNMEVIRRDQESIFGRFWRYESSTINLIPLNDQLPRQGGMVHVKGFVMDFRTFTPSFTNQYGIYSDDFVTFGTFSKDAGSPLDNEELLLQLVDKHNEHSSSIEDKTTFRFENNQLSLEREVNPELADT